MRHVGAGDLSDSVVLEPEVNQRRVIREHLPELQRALQSTGIATTSAPGLGSLPQTCGKGGRVGVGGQACWRAVGVRTLLQMALKPSSRYVSAWKRTA